MDTVLVLDTSKVQNYLVNKDFSLLVDHKNEILQSIYDNHKFLIRDEIEEDINYRQIIPYCLLKYGGRYVLFERLKKQSEVRLHSKLSLGAGGHINNQDDANEPSKIIENCIKRELDEEILVNYDMTKDITYVGVINDALSEVSMSHLGLLFEINLRDDNFQVREKNKMVAQWVTAEDIKSKYELLENWSKITFDQHINITE